MFTYFKKIYKNFKYIFQTRFFSLSKLLCEIKQYSIANEKSQLPN